MIAGDILGERARLTPDRLALVFVPTGERFTYSELNRRSVQCAAFLRDKLRLKRGERVGILAHNSVEFVEAFFAAGKSGIVLVPLNTRLTAHELEGVVRDSGMRALMYERDFGDTVRVLKANTRIEQYVVLDGCGSAEEIDYRAGARAVNDADWAPAACDPEDLYCVLYTSGTTGRPKGVVIPHRMVNWNAYNTAICWELGSNDVSPIFTPLCHAGGLGAFLTAIFLVGGTIVLHRGFQASEVWRVLETEGCSVMLGVPTIYKLLMDAPEFQSADLSSVRWFISGGAPLPLYLIEAYQKRGITFKQGYGMTEVGVNCFSMTEAESRTKPGSIGKPLMFTQARLVSSDGREVGVNHVGELWLRGPHVSRGYWNNPAITASSLDGEGWFHTGDLARCDEDGFYYIAGRLKDMFISGGVNVYPAEIEAELLLHEDIQEAAVIGVPHETWGEIGVAFVVPRGSSRAAPEELAEFLSKRLAKFKVPREFIIVEALPRTPYGKVVKRELQERYAAGRKSREAQA